MHAYDSYCRHMTERCSEK